MREDKPKDIDVPVQRKYTRVTMKRRKPEWVICPKCQHVIILREKGSGAR